MAKYLEGKPRQKLEAGRARQAAHRGEVDAVTFDRERARETLGRRQADLDSMMREQVRYIPAQKEAREAAINRAREELDALNTKYADLQREGAPIAALVTACEKFLRDRGFILPGESQPQVISVDDRDALLDRSPGSFRAVTYR